MSTRATTCSQRVTAIQASATSIAAQISAMPGNAESNYAPQLIQAMGHLQQAQRLMAEAQAVLDQIAYAG